MAGHSRPTSKPYFNCRDPRHGRKSVAYVPSQPASQRELSSADCHRYTVINMSVWDDTELRRMRFRHLRNIRDYSIVSLEPDSYANYEHCSTVIRSIVKIPCWRKTAQVTQQAVRLWRLRTLAIKSARRDACCSLAVVRRNQKFSPRRRPPSRGAGQPEFNQLEMVTTFTYRLSLVKIDARNFELSW